MNVNVGDEVVTTRDRVGKVIRITPTGRIVVRFSNGYEHTFRADGVGFDNDLWHNEIIVPLTAKKKRELYERSVIIKCRKEFNEASIDFDKAQRILKILLEDRSES